MALPPKNLAPKISSCSSVFSTVGVSMVAVVVDVDVDFDFGVTFLFWGLMRVDLVCFSAWRVVAVGAATITACCLLVANVGADGIVKELATSELRSCRMTSAIGLKQEEFTIFCFVYNVYNTLMG